jgi:hypothetical protein
MKKNSDKEKDLEEFRKKLESTSEKKIDGHTSSQDLTAKEKLIWLSELNYFKYIVKK